MLRALATFVDLLQGSATIITPALGHSLWVTTDLGHSSLSGPSCLTEVFVVGLEVLGKRLLLVLRTEDPSSGLLWGLVSEGVDCPIVGKFSHKMAAEPQALRVGGSHRGFCVWLPLFGPFSWPHTQTAYASAGVSETFTWDVFMGESLISTDVF